MDSELKLYQDNYIRHLRDAAAPILAFTREAARYKLNLAQVQALHDAAADPQNLLELYFQAGFAVGRQYERDKLQQS